MLRVRQLLSRPLNLYLQDHDSIFLCGGQPLFLSLYMREEGESKKGLERHHLAAPLLGSRDSLPPPPPVSRARPGAWACGSAGWATTATCSSLPVSAPPIQITSPLPARGGCLILCLPPPHSAISLSVFLSVILSLPLSLPFSLSFLLSLSHSLRVSLNPLCRVAHHTLPHSQQNPQSVRHTYA